MSVLYNTFYYYDANFVQKSMQSLKWSVGSVNINSKILYAIGIGANLFVGLAHITYTFIAYETIDEQALWFFSGALAVIFNAAVNFLCIKECTKLTYVTGVIVNLALLVFTVVLAIVVREAHTVFVTAIILYTTVLCGSHSIQIRKKTFASTSA